MTQFFFMSINLTFNRWQERVKDSTLAGTLVDMRGANYWIKQTSECMNQLNNE